MTDKTAGVVLHCLKYGESSHIVNIYTEASGRLSYIIKVSRGRRGGVRSSLFHPLSIVEVDAEGRNTAQLRRITEARLLHPLHTLSTDPYKLAITLFLGEFLHHALREEGTNRPLFTYLMHSIRWLDGCATERVSNFHLVFLMRLLRFLGLYPNLEAYRPGCYFDMLNAEFVFRQPLHSNFLRPDEAASVRVMMRMNYENMHLFALNRLQRVRCLEVLNEYYRLHLPGFPQLRSLEVLKEIFV
ncbi:MAG: DNA repair protein RecO [Bacteroidaceae bacterium]|nr:DNA repair protein RecO [Bacteroidaceae bacterium]